MVRIQVREDGIHRKGVNYENMWGVKRKEVGKWRARWGVREVSVQREEEEAVGRVRDQESSSAGSDRKV